MYIRLYISSYIPKPIHTTLYILIPATDSLISSYLLRIYPPIYPHTCCTHYSIYAHTCYTNYTYYSMLIAVIDVYLPDMCPLRMPTIYIRPHTYYIYFYRYVLIP